MLQLIAAAATLPALGVAPRARADSQFDAVVASDLEVVTVTDTSVVITWVTQSPGKCDSYGRAFPVASDSELLMGPADSLAPLHQAWFSGASTPFHYAEVQGLEPGRAYRFEARSNGMKAVPSAVGTIRPGAPESTGRFTTLTPPAGRHVRTIALTNDVHFGEQTSGIIAAGLPPGFHQDPGLPPYPEVMLDGVLDDLRAPDRGADHLLVAGDLTAEASPADASAVRARLDTWGSLGRDYFVSRGNHDRPHTGSDYASCSVVPDARDHHDCWGDAFLPRQHLLEHDLGGLRLLTLDTTELDGSGGTIDAQQMSEVRAALRDNRDRPTLVFGHHPVTVESGLTNLAGPGFVLDQQSSRELQELYSGAPGVFLHHSGHTHRNKRTRPDTDAAVEFLEVGAVKEYPGGYSLVRLYEGGYMTNFYKTRSDPARQWTHRSRGEYFGLYPDYTLGTVEDRNHVVHRDLSGLTRV